MKLLTDTVMHFHRFSQDGDTCVKDFSDIHCKTQYILSDTFLKPEMIYWFVLELTKISN